MRGAEAAWLGAVLLLVPAAAWFFGRFAGRRDWSVAVILAGALVIGGGFYGAMIAAQALAVPSQSHFLGWPEIPGFLIVFAGFVGLIGWAGTPVTMRPKGTPRS